MGPRKGFKYLDHPILPCMYVVERGLVVVR
ncbi:hypothetical protein AIOGIFDO_02083 [Candidatus Methanoperedenaceae archaeon GB37]|nr:hypothetical protein AIOGIFDO_02083 [Candidatus Methanoperedenaceae archaeon GB37]